MDDKLHQTSATSLVIERRQVHVEEVSEFIKSCNHTLEEVLKGIGWSREELQDQEPLLPCPRNTNHAVQRESLNAHVKRCEWSGDGYSKAERENAEDLSHNEFFYEKSNSVHGVTLDNSTGTLPRTMDRLAVEASPSERLALYETALEKCQARRREEQDYTDLELNLDQDQNDDDNAGAKPKSRLEVLAEMRDYRRRRQSYRAKNVHITRKTKTDVMREIIDTHMKFLEETSRLEGNSKDNEKPWAGHAERSPRDETKVSLSGRDSSGQQQRSRSRKRDDGDRDRRSRSHSKEGGSGSGSRSSHHSEHRHGSHSKHKHKSKHRSQRNDDERD
ncbi:U11/U12 small nuclear ribonucleoprotein 48 kDa protein-like [Diadema antillarum]|uniref:U11/U12 small nuclear ribonucleoprotein 48 kDa protein-like n=1 Tax=Diadema antillarum TaxID=105358 RepID=UPI003A8361DB